MTDSLTLSLLLLCALLILLVLLREVWRGWRLRGERIRLAPAASRSGGPKRPFEARRELRQEPGLESFDLAAAERREPDFAPEGAIANASKPAEFVIESRPPETLAVDPQPQEAAATVPPEAAAAPVPPPPPRVFQDVSLTEPSGGAPVAPLASPKPDRSADPPLQFVAETPAQSGAAHSLGERIPKPLPPAPPMRSSAPQSVQSRPLVPQALLSPETDCIIEISCVAPVTGERLVPWAHSFRRCGTKPVLIEVPDVIGESGIPQAWRSPRPDDRCAVLRIGILLDNRSGPLNAMEFSEFVARVQEIAERLGGRFVAPSLSDVLQAARRLDADCVQLDWTAGLNVDASELLGPTQLAALAGPLVITERGNNRYARLDGDGDPVFSLFLGERPNRLTFLLDLPRVQGPIEAWDQMVECAWIAARRLPGRLVDDAGKPLTERVLENISSQVRQRALALEAAGLKAGSLAARRVFN